LRAAGAPPSDLEAPMREIATADGKLVLTEPALAAVAAAAALRCPGVVATAGRRLQDELADLLREGQVREGGGTRGVEVELDAERCTIALDLVVAYGARLSEVCRAVMAAVAREVAAAAGFVPERVDVRVIGVRPNGAPPAPGAAEPPAAQGRPR